MSTNPDKKTWTNGKMTITVNMRALEGDPELYGVLIDGESKVLWDSLWTRQQIDEFCQGNGISCPDFKGRKDSSVKKTL